MLAQEQARCDNILSITGSNSENFFRNHIFEHASFSEIKKINIISIDSIMAEVTFQIVRVECALFYNEPFEQFKILKYG